MPRPVLFFIHLGTRRVIVSGVTANPNAAWVIQQARNASMEMDELKLPAKYLLIDHDTKFTASFDAVFEADDAKVQRVGPMAPNMNAYAERFAQTLRGCLDQFLVLGENHLRYITHEVVEYYNTERPHQGRGNVPLPDAVANDAKSASTTTQGQADRAKPTDSEPTILRFPSGKVNCKERLGGLLKHYYRQAA